uniref:SPOR domain-containing protein n=1 Tax=Sandarakinorhabdus oryzae TaxID=2675220 RepID=UPI0018CC3763
VMPAGPPAPARTAPPKPAATLPAPAAVKPAPVKPPVTAPAAPAPKTPPAATAAAKPATAPAKTASGLVQIGAFSSEAKAEEEWARVSGKGKLSGKQIQKLTSSSGKTLWRVRGQAADVDAACKAILAAGGACEAVRK